MQRHHNHKIGLTLETLEGRDLQSGIITGGQQALLPTGQTNAAIITTQTGSPSPHQYFAVTGFFGQ